MSQHDFDVANGSGLGVRTDLNNALQALASQSSGAAAPSPTLPCQEWADTGTGRLMRRNSANTAWLDVGALDSNLRDAVNGCSYVAGAGSANTYTATYVPAVTALIDGLTLDTTAIAANTGASTFSPNGVAAKPIVSLGQAALVGGELPINSRFTIQYSATLDAWILLSASGGTALSGRLIKTQVLTAAGTYTPTPGMKNCKARGVGGGGGSGGAGATNASQVGVSSGAASGSYSEGWFTAAQIGASQSVVIGGGGVAGVSGGGGNSGGATTLGSLMSAPGGGGSASGAAVASTAFSLASGGLPGAVATGGTIANTAGQQGGPGIISSTSILSGAGGSSPLGAGGPQGSSASPGSGYGAGASGAASGVSNAAKPGAAGSPGVLIIEEYT